MAEGDNISNFICQDDTDVALVSSPVGVPFLEDSSSDTSENRYVPSSRAQYLSHYFRLAFQCSYLSWMAVIIVILMSVVAILVGEVVSTRRSDDLDRFFYCRTISGKRIFETSNVRDIRIEVLESSIAGAYIITAITSIILALILQRKKHQARRGDASAALGIILPTYEPILWVIAIISVLGFTLTVILFVNGSSGQAANDVVSTNTDTTLDCTYTLGPFIGTSVMLPFLFMQKSITRRTIRMAVVAGILVAASFMLLYVSTGSASHSTKATMLFVFYIILALIFVVSLLANRSRYSIIAYNVFSVSWTLCIGIYYILVLGQTEEHWILLTGILIGSAFPILVVLVLQEDTRYWSVQHLHSLMGFNIDHRRGIGQMQGDNALQQLSGSRLSTVVSAYHMHHMIDIHRKRMIDFAYLQFGKQIGRGATATVYHGYLKGETEVAIKVYTPLEVTYEEVDRFSQETAFNSFLSHPSIATFHGLCVLPPNICLVFEYCSKGALNELLIASDKLTMNQKLSLAVGACNGVIFLHSQSPKIIHMDIKAGNYLCTENFVVKLTDFGEARVLIEGLELTNLYGTVSYMAPEIIRQEPPFGTAVDVYSLAITIWTIIYPEMQLYPTLHNAHEVYDAVQNGIRPECPSDDFGKDVEEILSAAWCNNREERISAGELQTKLERLMSKY